jgi:acyl carrier protein
MVSEQSQKAPIVAMITSVLDIVREMSPTADVEPDSELVAELGFDSLGLIELVAVLEDALDLPPIDMDALSTIVTVSDLQSVVREARAVMLPTAGSK